MSSVRRSVRPAARAMLAMALAALLAGCVSFESGAEEEPPGARDATETIVDRIGSVDGVTDVEWNLGREGGTYLGGEWIASITVLTDSAELRRATAVREAARGDIPGAELALGIEFPAGAGAAPVRLDPFVSGAIERAEALRVLPQVDRVDIADGWTILDLDVAAGFRDAATAVRSAIDDRELVIDLRRTAAISLSMTATVPDDALLRTLDGVANAPTTRWLSFIPAARSGSRSQVSVTTTAVPGTAQALVDTLDAAADAGAAPRTAFDVSDETGERSRDGFVGLPLGSPEPDDLYATPPPTAAEREVAEAALGAASQSVREFLERAVVVGGVGAAVDVSVSACAAGGRQAIGSVLVPVFESMDDAQAPFDAIVAGWARGGFVRVDRAMGTDIWASRDPSPGSVASASIRGTAEGLRLSAESACTTV